MGTAAISDDLLAQREHIKTLETKGFEFGFTVADSFIRGIRDMGYRSTGRALDELIDNAIQAEASKIVVAFGFEGSSDAKPSAIAIVDDGHGMDPTMIRESVRWGGTHRENDRTGMGRYGFGLPSSCVSQGQRFTVYSIVAGGEMHAVTVDLEEISREVRESPHGNVSVPEPAVAAPPKWLQKEIKERFGSALKQGTIVLIERLDRLSWRTKSGLQRNLLQGIGVTYRNFLRRVDIWVGDKKVDAIDPLFTTPGARFYDLDEERAEALDEHVFEVTDPETRKSQGHVKVRYSFMSPTFARVDKDVERGKNNKRFRILADHNGLIVLREGRQIDVIPRATSATGQTWLAVNNDDRYWGVEIDLPATLDEEMSITVSKQQITLSDRIWNLLKEQGVMANITAFRKRYDEEKAKLRAERDQRKADAEEKARSSEQAMAHADKFRKKNPESAEGKQKSTENFKREVDKRTKQSGVPREQVEKQLRDETERSPYRVRSESSRGAPFFWVEQLGPQKVLTLNTAHRFYRDVYAAPDSTARTRAALEVVLFAIGVEELDAKGDRLTFYETEIGVWSATLNTALTQLENIDPTAEEREADDAHEDEDEAAVADAVSA